jgi:hypothetical protein
MVGEPVDQPEQAGDHQRYADQHGRDGQRRLRPDQQHQADYQASPVPPSSAAKRRQITTRGG